MQKNKRILARYLGLMLMLFSVSLGSLAQQTIQGKVFDPDGSPLLGATVVVNGTSNGTITDAEGAYKLSAPSNGELKFSYVGLSNLTVKISGKTTINVTLQSDAIGLNEVVAVGYGTMKKVDVTGAVASVKGDMIAKSGAFSAANAIQGKMAGVVVTNNGDAGSNAKIRIRGVNTIGNNDPLVVVDGVTNGASIMDINPTDIESIDVLKDASALAIYGSRASSGVILITTKTGSYGEQKVKISLDASYGVATIPQRLNMVSSAKIVEIIDESRTNENTMLGNSAQLLYDAIWPGDNWGRQDLTDWQNELFNTGIVQDYSLSAAGGSKVAKYSFGVSYRNQEGTMPGNFATRYTLRGTMETKALKDKLKVGTTINYSSRESRNSTQGFIWSADLFRSVQVPGNIPAYFPNSDKGYQEVDAKKIAYFMPGDLYQNSAVIFNDISNPVHNIATTLYAELEILKGLNFKTLVGQNFSQTYNRNFEMGSLNPQGGDSRLDLASNRSFSTSWDNTLTFDKKINGLSVNLLAGINTTNFNTNQFSASRSGFPTGDPEGLRYLGFGNALTVVNGENASNVRLASYFGRVNLSYNDKYLLTATVRRDGSSRFYDANRWGVFPSFSTGWRISEEPFMKSISWLDMLKIRASWGKVGNQNVGTDYAYISSTRSGFVSQNSSTDQAFGVTPVRQTGKVILRRGNKDLVWESTAMTNIGLDYSIKKISGSVEYFNNYTSDILLDAQYPSIAGYYETQKVNSGEVRSQGFEFNLNYGDKKGDFGYDLGLNFTYAENEIMSLSTNKFVQGGNTIFKGITQSMSRSYVGDPIGSFYGWQLDGIFNTAEEVAAANLNARTKAQERATAAGKPLTDAELANVYHVHKNTAPGDYKFKDNNGDGIINDDDKANLGSGTPKFHFGLNFSCNYKAFDLSIGMLGVTGVQIYTMYEPALLQPHAFAKLSSIVDHWTPENQTTNFPRYTVSDPNKNLRSSDKWIHDGSYLRFQNIILGYTLPNKMLSKVGIDKLRAFVNVQNLYTLTSYPFLDPEVSGTSFDGATTDTASGVDVGSSPTPRTIMFGLNINF